MTRARDKAAAGSGEPAAESAPAQAVEPEVEAGADPDSSGPEAAAAVEHDLDELVTKAAERDEYLSLAQRTQADFENFRKRASKDQAAAERRGLAKLAGELLTALDNLSRAIAAAEAEEGADSDHHLTKGIRLVQQELVASLARVGIEAFSPEGERFDPEQHEAMAQHPVEGAESGTVVEVYQPGYRLDDVILRPARVVVAG